MIRVPMAYFVSLVFHVVCFDAGAEGKSDAHVALEREEDEAAGIPPSDLKVRLYDNGGIDNRLICFR